MPGNFELLSPPVCMCSVSTNLLHRALSRVLQEAPTLAVVNNQQLMELAYVTASQPRRHSGESQQAFQVVGESNGGGGGG